MVAACPGGFSGRIARPGACTGHRESPGRPAGNHQPAPQGLAAVHPRQPSVAQALRLLDETGTEVEPGTPGTLFVRGASAATGYWSRYDTSRQVFQGEWLRTGDTYVRDADGYYACLGRTGDMLKASGIWVSPAEVEARLLAHRAVAQAIVVAAPDANGLEKLVAFVIAEPRATATEDELIEFCRQALPSFKRPRKVVFVTSYPTTATGKVRRVELRRMAATVFVPGDDHPPTEAVPSRMSAR